MIDNMDVKYREIKDLSAYLDFLAESSKIIIVCVKDTVGYWFDNNIQKKFWGLGLKEILSQKLLSGYVAIIDNKDVVYEKLGLEDEKITCEHHIGTHLLQIISATFQGGNCASICIDGVECAVNDRGINIVVFDKNTNKILDSVAFDTHVKEIYCTRIKEHYDIGVVGCWWGTNYGSCLNGYAVYKVLKSFGLKIWMINRHDFEARRDTPNIKFVRKMYADDEISPIISMERLQTINEKCDIFLAGSDQIWKYWLNSLYDLEFMLKFANDSKKKISFSSSFGHAWDSTPQNVFPETYKLLRRFDAISVREKSGVEICKNIYRINAVKVLEPVFCLPKHEYNVIASYSTLREDEPFILSYILDPTEEIRNAIIAYSDLLGMKSVNVLDLDYMVYEENHKKLNLENIMPQISPEDLMFLFSRCSFILTDSFHGTAFSIIFNKPFLSIINMKRGSIRFLEMLSEYGLMSRLVQNPTEIPISLDYTVEIEYGDINRKIEDAREKTIEWLKRAIETPKAQMPSIILPDTVSNVLKKTDCTGCSACVNICPANAISLKPDDLGYYRADVDYDKCIGCGKCIEICPTIKLPENGNRIQPNLFEFIAADEKILFHSSSGGAFPVLASETFKRDGVVVGAAWRDDFSVEHIIIENEAELYKLQKSKYLQSDLGNTFEKVKEKLDSGVFVLFSGCPCQAAGLKAYLQKEYDNLIIIDLLCGNAPSTMFFKKYIEDDFSEPLKKYEFRHKAQGWNADCANTTTISGYTEVRRGGKQDSYQRIYHNHVMCPLHCENCKYQNAPRFGDLTIGDFWGVSKYDKDIDTSKGVSAVLCNNEKGQVFFENIPQEMYSVKKQVPLEWLGGNGFVIRGSHNFSSPRRNDFYEAIRYKPFKDAISYALKPNHGIHSERGVFDFKAKDTHFKFNPSIWNEDYINGITILTTSEKYPKTGNYATMPIFNSIEKDKAYILKLRFKISTDAQIYNFHLKSAGETLTQVIYSHQVNAEDSTNWVEITHEFVPDSDIYDEFMIGAAQLTGENRWIAIDYIRICEK